MLRNPPNCVELIGKEQRWYQFPELHSERLSTKKSESDGFVHVKLGADDKSRSTNETNLSSASINLTVVNNQNQSEKPAVRQTSGVIRWFANENKIEIIPLKNAAETSLKDEPVSLISQGNINQQIPQASPSETELITVHPENSTQKHPWSCASHCSTIRVFLILLAIILLCTALAALLVSILTKPKDTTTTRSMISILWTFDNNTNDVSDTYNGLAVNNPSYVPGYNGLNGEAINLNGSLSQYIQVNDPLIEFTYRSFTIEMWFYPTVLITADFGLFGQCETVAQDRCLMLLIRNDQVYAGFDNDDLSGTTSILTNRWYHVAFVYDYSTSTQYLYLNGYLENSHVSNKYQGASKPLTIGAIKTDPSNFFFGYIDQVSLVTTVKTADEILYDATFVCYYSFDTIPYLDSGPWNFTGLNNGLSLANGTGLVNDAVSFTSPNTYFLFGGLNLLGTSGQSYSIALWIKPTSVSGGTIVYISRCNTNCGSNWCMPFIGFTLSGRIVIQSWSSASGGTLVTLTGPVLFTNVWLHIAYTYSVTNGIRLYLNGLLFQQSSVFLYLGSSSANYIYLGSFPLTACAQTSGIIPATQYYGILDEYYLYARELTATEVLALANP